MIFFRRSPIYDRDGEITLALRWRIWTSGWPGVVVFSLGLALVVGIWQGPAFYHGLQRHRVQRLLDQAGEARRKGNLPGAEALLNEAVAILPSHPGTLREMARQRVMTRPSVAIQCYTQLLRSGQATGGDAMALAHLAFRSGQLELARAVMRHLEEQKLPREGTGMLSLLAEERLWNGQWEAALQTARKAVVTPGPPEEVAQARLLLARLLQQGPSESSLRHVQERLELLGSLAGGMDDASLEALQQLIRLAADSRAAVLFQGRSETATWFEISQAHPLAAADLKIGAWNLRLAAQPGRRAEILRELFDRIKTDGSSPLALEGARWFNLHSEPALALELAESGGASASPARAAEWMLIRLDALGSMGRWAEVVRQLQDPSTMDLIPPSIQMLFELRASLEAGRNPDVAGAWHSIHRTLRNEPLPNQLYVAGYAETAGFKDQAAVVYARLLDLDQPGDDSVPRASRAARLACHAGLLRVAGFSLGGSELLKRLRQFAAEFPEIDEVQADWAYWELLLQETESERASMTAQNLLRKRPELLAYRTVAALAALRAGRAAEAVGLYEGWKIDWASARARFKAVYLGALRAAGRASGAEAGQLGLESAGLFPEERQLAGL